VTRHNPPVRRGQIYWIDWGKGHGAEQSGRRPGVIIQDNAANRNETYPLTIIAAVSSQGRNVRSHVSILPSDANGLSIPSHVKCEQLQTVAKDRLDGLIGVLDNSDMDRVDDALATVLSSRSRRG